MAYGKNLKSILSPQKARKMLHEGKAGGRALSPKQKRFFGFIAGGGKPSRG